MGIETNGTRYFDRYVLLAKRAQTVNGALWDARDDASGEALTIEVIDPQHARRSDIWARLQRDHALSSRLAHSNVLAVYEPKRSESVTFLPMQFAANGDARSLTVVAYDEILPILIDVAEALRHAHSLGIAHLALSLHSIRLDAGNCALVSGFQFETGTPEEFAAAVRKDLRDFAMLAGELLDESASALRRTVPPRLRALFDAAYDSSFAPTPLSFVTIVDELELALHDTAPLELGHFDVEQTASLQRRHAARIAAEQSAKPSTQLEAASLPASAMVAEQHHVQDDWSALGLQAAPSLQRLAMPALAVGPSTSTMSASSLSDEAPRGTPESPAAPCDVQSSGDDGRGDVRRGRRVRREVLAWRWLTSGVAVAVVGTAFYLGAKNEALIANQRQSAPGVSQAPLATRPTTQSPQGIPVATGIAALRTAPVRAANSTAPKSTTVRPEAARIDKLQADGEAALNDFDAARARRAFTNVLRIEPAHLGAQLGLRRVRVLDGVRAVVDDARRAEVARNYTRAAQGYSHALTLDRDHRVPRLGIKRVSRAVQADAILSGLVAAHAELGAGRLDAAQTAFLALAQIHGKDSRVRDGLRLADAALVARQLAPQMRQAANFERAQEWAAAMQIYDSLLAAYPDYIPAQQGRRRVATRTESSATAVNAGPTSPANGY